MVIEVEGEGLLAALPLLQQPGGNREALESGLQAEHIERGTMVHPSTGEQHNQAVVEIVELSEEEEREEQAVQVHSSPLRMSTEEVTATTFAEPENTPEDQDVFAPEARLPLHVIPEAEAETLNADHLDTQAELEAVSCPICMEPWTSTGSHRICSLECGHLFGKSCIKRWLKQAGRKQGKCPHCNRRARLEDLRTLYVPRIAVIDGEGQHYMQEASLLRTENEQLRGQVAELLEEVQRSQALLAMVCQQQHGAVDAFQRLTHQQAQYIPKETTRQGPHRLLPPPVHPLARKHHFPSENIPPQNLFQNGVKRQKFFGQLENMSYNRNRSSAGVPSEESSRQQILEERQNFRELGARDSSGSGHTPGLMAELRREMEESTAARPLRSFPSLASIGSRGVGNSFVLQDELPLHGAKVFDMDGQSQLLLVSGRPATSMTSSGLTKMSLLALSEGECMDLPPGTGAVRDIRIAPSGTRAPGRLALVASLGKKLTIFSLESNNVVITYSLQSPSWACAWDPCDPNQVYTGLQNGSLVVFDMRQTASPIATLKGPSSSPMHTVQYVPEHTTLKEGSGLLTASSSSLLFWPSATSSGYQSEGSRALGLSHPGSSSVCVSLSYEATIDMAVASLRPKPIPNPSNEGTSSSSPLMHSQADATSQPSSSSHTETIATPSISMHIPTHYSYIRKPKPQSLIARLDESPILETEYSWEQEGSMVGHKSQMVVSRSAIVCEWRSGQSSRSGPNVGQGSLFAFGDEGSNSVWLWDISTQARKQALIPHHSPVLDIRSLQIAGMDLLGCISERTLQLYRRLPS